MALNLKIITPDGILFDGEIDSVNVKTTEGYISILEWHIPIIANLAISPMTYRIKDKVRNLTVAGGLLITNLHEVRIISDKIEYTSILRAEEKNASTQRVKKITNT